MTERDIKLYLKDILEAIKKFVKVMNFEHLKIMTLFQVQLLENLK